ncbi:hypothetical protein BS47DRAFT_1338479 [Hydnum rufescens UP504]|uniref:F-box domain-containing protein n=1 Tax=Hydnum rufescens UP504 TaxID=1448309 RepID=A0A9P6B625_9AGAM|nr:hypothetical protein BS47DRAFT_1338479 [Hydnum rufescens UP504]
MDETSKLCDTIPPPQHLAYAPRFVFEPRSLNREPEPAISDAFDTSFRASGLHSDSTHTPIRHSNPTDIPEPTPARQLCVRHKRMADQGTNLKLQKSLDALPVAERETVNTLWSMFSSSTHARRAIILQGILTMCCSTQLSMLAEQVPQLLRIDPFFVLPREVSLQVLKYLDATSLARAAQVSQQWHSLADDDILWRNMCEQHIEKRCNKCGWGLPLLEKKRIGARKTGMASSSSHTKSKRPMPFDNDPDHTLSSPKSDTTGLESVSKRRKVVHSHLAALARIPSFSDPGVSVASHDSPCLSDSDSESSLMDAGLNVRGAFTRPWKDVYSERLTVERNWRRGRYNVTVLRGHADGIMCLQINENLSHPNFPVLITGSYDRTARVWNLETGREVLCLRGHTRAIRAIQFDEAKLITGSMDRTLKVWNWRTGKCIRTLEGHTEGVVSLAFDANILASGSVDTTVKIWNFRTGECFTLRGHRDWVNAVAIWDGKSVAPSHHEVETIPSGCLPDLDSGKMLFSASDDASIRLWDLTSRTCVRQLNGHVGQVQSIRVVYIDCEESNEDQGSEKSRPDGLQAALRDSSGTGPTIPPTSLQGAHGSTPRHRKRGPHPLLISGSLDNTLKLWDIESGNTLHTYFGHIEGIWAVASDKLRLVSASHDRTIKANLGARRRLCTSTLFGHLGAVTCLALSDDKIVSGSDDGDVRIWSFAPELASTPAAPSPPPTLPLVSSPVFSSHH